MSSPLDRARQVFGDALERNATSRAAFLAEACGEDASVRELVARMLADHELLEAAFAEPAGAGERPGDLIGSYKLLESIGEGGFGTVWMAEQQQPVRRRVALKIVKWGMDTRQVVARFEAERQALALMDHPNIATVFDGGATQTGRPYFAMELVRGVPITQYCDEAKLTPKERIALLVPVCDAVQHAHQKGVIHRDLKPSNVLVTHHDGRPVPKVIDFGIAKATSGPLTDKTVCTGFRQMLGTPEYMAPEQADLSGLDVDTRADVYSLGVLLYELLTGTKPFEWKEALHAGWAELLRRIKEIDPEKPSTRVSTLESRRVITVATNRRMLPKGLSGACRGDLDRIALKAMEKAPSRRYETAHALAEDLQRHLRDEPVLASPPSRRYRFEKYLRRHRIAVSAGAAIALALLVGSAAALWGYFRAERHAADALRSARIAGANASEAGLARIEEERQRGLAEKRALEAQQQAARAQHVVELLRRMLASSDPHERKGREYRVRELLADFERELGAHLHAEPAVEATLRATLGTTYLGLGLLEEAAPHLERSLALHAALYGGESPEHAVAAADFARLRHDQGRYAEAAELLERAAAVAAAAGERWRADLARYEREGADNMHHLGRGARALELARRSLAVQCELSGPCDAEVAGTRGTLARVLSFQGEHAEAEAQCRLTLELCLQLHGERDLETATAHQNLGEHLRAAGRLQEAEEQHRTALVIRCELLPTPHALIAISLRELGEVLMEEGHLAEAAALHDAALSMAEQTLGGEHPTVAEHLAALAETWKARGELSAAEAALRRALDLQRRVFGEPHFAVATTRSQLGLLLLERGEAALAEAEQRAALASRNALFGDEDEAVASSLNNLAIALQSQDRHEEAEELQRRALDMQRRIHGDVHPSVATSWHNLGRLLLQRGRYEDAEAAAQEAVNQRASLFGEDHPAVAESQCAVGEILQHRGEHAEAEGLLRQALNRVIARLGEVHSLTARLRRELANSLLALARYGEAIAELERSLATERLIYGEDHPSVAVLLDDLGRVFLEQGRLADAERIYRELLAVPAERLAQSPVNALAARNNLATVLWKRGKPAEAEPLYREVADGLLEVVGDQHGDYATALHNIGTMLHEQGNRKEAERFLRRALDLRTKLVDRVNLPSSQNGLGLLLLDLRKAPEAERLFRAALAGLEEMYPAQHPHVTTCRNNIGLALARQGKSKEAEPFYREALEGDRLSLGATHAKNATTLSNLARVLEAQSENEEAIHCLEEAVSIVRAAGPDYLRQLAMETNGLGCMLVRRGDLARGEPFLAEAVELARTHYGETHRGHIECLRDHGDALRGLRRFAESRKRYELALELARGQQDLGATELLEMKLALMLQEAGELSSAASVLRDQLARREEQLGKDDPQLARTRLCLGQLLLQSGKPVEAEPLLRESLRAFTAARSTTWESGFAEALIGGCVLESGKFEEAETLLRAGYERMLKAEDSRVMRPPVEEYLARLCDARGEPAEAAAWRAKRGGDAGAPERESSRR